MNTERISQDQKAIYAMKQLMTIEKLREYRKQCWLEDMEKGIAQLEITMKAGK